MHPVLFHILWVEIQTSLILIFFWLLLSAIYLEKKVKINKLLINFLSDYFLAFVSLFFIIWRLWWVALKWDIYNENILRIFYFWDWNFSFYIWLAWVLIFLFILTKIKKEAFRKWMDTILFPFLFLIIFISFANLMSWENYWKPSSLPFPFSYTFNSPEVRYAIPIHPTQLYESISIIFLFFVMKFFARKKRIIWIVSLLWFSLFFLTEFLLEFLRAGSDKIILWYKFHSILFLLWLVICLITLIFKSHRNFYFHTHD